MTSWEGHRSWSSNNNMRSCWRTQCWPFYGHSTFEANWKDEKAWKMGASWINWKLKKKLSLWSVIFSSSVQQRQTISQLVVTCDEKWILWQLATTVDGLRRSSKALPKAWLAPKKMVMVTLWWSTTCLIRYRFLNPCAIITSEKYDQQINEMHWKLQGLQPALVNRKGSFLLQDNARLQVAQPSLRKLNKLSHEVIPLPPYSLTSCQLTTTSSSISTTFFRGNASQPSGGKNAFQEFIESQSMDFYAIGINKFISCWQKCVDCMVPILINKDVFEPNFNDLKFNVQNCNYFFTNLIFAQN